MIEAFTIIAVGLAMALIGGYAVRMIIFQQHRWPYQLQRQQFIANKKLWVVSGRRTLLINSLSGNFAPITFLNDEHRAIYQAEVYGPVLKAMRELEIVK